MTTELTLLSFSGAHGTGKTTLIADLRVALSRIYGPDAIHRSLSFSSTLFARIKDGLIERPEPADQRPECYDDLDVYGLRSWFQELLPDALVFEVEHILLYTRGQPRVIALIDRWFPDIYAYTLIECEDEKVRELVLERCRSRYEGLKFYLLQKYDTVKIANVFVPTSASTFRAQGQEGKFRATCDRDRFEELCLANWKNVLGCEAPNLVTKVTRRGRVTEMTAFVSELLSPVHSHE